MIFPIPKGKLSFVLLDSGKIFGGVRGLTKAEGNGETWTNTKWTSAAVGSPTAKVALYATFRGVIWAERKLYMDLCEGERGDGDSGVKDEAEEIGG